MTETTRINSSKLRLARFEERQSRFPIYPEENFDNWKSVVGLPASFPYLHPLRWDELSDIRFGPGQDEAKRKIAAHALSPDQNPFTVVLIKPGHGATTLARHIYQRLTTEWGRNTLDRTIDPRNERKQPTSAEVSRVIPVFVEVAALQGDVEEGIQERAREAIVRSLSETNWGSETTHARAVGGVAEDINLEEQMGQLKGVLSYVDHDKPRPVDWEKVKAVAPGLVNASLTDLVVMLRRDFKVTPVFLVDLSGFNGNLADVVGVMKDLEEAPSHTLQEGRDPVGQIYFTSDETHSHMQALYNRSGARIRYPAVQGIDVFRMIMDQNPRRVNRRAPALSPAPVVSSGIMQSVERKMMIEEGKRIEDFRIDDVVARFREEILRKMNRHWAEITFHLE